MIIFQHRQEPSIAKGKVPFHAPVVDLVLGGRLWALLPMLLKWLVLKRVVPAKLKEFSQSQRICVRKVTYVVLKRITRRLRSQYIVISRLILKLHKTLLNTYLAKKVYIVVYSTSSLIIMCCLSSRWIWSSFPYVWCVSSSAISFVCIVPLTDGRCRTISLFVVILCSRLQRFIHL